MGFRRRERWQEKEEGEGAESEGGIDRHRIQFRLFFLYFLGDWRLTLASVFVPDAFEESKNRG